LEAGEKGKGLLLFVNWDKLRFGGVLRLHLFIRGAVTAKPWLRGLKLVILSHFLRVTIPSTVLACGLGCCAPVGHVQQCLKRQLSSPLETSPPGRAHRSAVPADCEAVCFPSIN